MTSRTPLHTLLASALLTAACLFVARPAAALVLCFTNDGSTQDCPVLPTSSADGRFGFADVGSGLWFDPPATSAIEYVMDTPGAYFTAIGGFPVGFDPLTVSTGTTVLGTDFGAFHPQVLTLDFATPGVRSFVVSSITPAVDLATSNPTAFPLNLSFSTATASFHMLAVPEPSTLALSALLLVLVPAARCLRVRRG